MKTKLIQELVGLCVEKGLDFKYSVDMDTFVVRNLMDIYYLGGIKEKDAPDQLQAAIDKVKGL